MKPEKKFNIYFKLYSFLIRFYPKKFYNKFGLEMKIVFNDLIKQNSKENKSIFLFFIKTIFETSHEIIKSNFNTLYMNYKNLVKVFLVCLGLLSIPFIAMQVSSEVNWSVFDFIAAFILLFGAGLSYLFITKKLINKTYKIAAAITVFTALFLVWANLAVGIIGSEDNEINVLFFGVILIGFLGTVISKLKPLGMSNALIVTAIAQAVVLVIALIIKQPEITIGVFQVIIFNMFFVTLWLTAAILFRRADSNKNLTLKTI